MSQAAAPLLRKLRLKFIALNMALACGQLRIKEVRKGTGQ